MWLLAFACDAPDLATDHLAPGPVGEVARAADLLVYARRDAGARSTVLVRVHGGAESVLLDDGGNPDRPAVSPDGRTVGYVSAASGLASVWVLDVTTGRRDQLTNLGLVPGNGRPAGWVPPPHDAPPRFEGRTLRWDTPEGPAAVDLPSDWP